MAALGPLGLWPVCGKVSQRGGPLRSALREEEWGSPAAAPFVSTRGLGRYERYPRLARGCSTCCWPIDVWRLVVDIVCDAGLVGDGVSC